MTRIRTARRTSTLEIRSLYDRRHGVKAARTRTRNTRTMIEQIAIRTSARTHLRVVVFLLWRWRCVSQPARASLAVGSSSMSTLAINGTASRPMWGTQMERLVEGRKGLVAGTCQCGCRERCVALGRVARLSRVFPPRRRLVPAVGRAAHRRPTTPAAVR